jgi:hypothetical protein
MGALFQDGVVDGTVGRNITLTLTDLTSSRQLSGHHFGSQFGPVWGLALGVAYAFDPLEFKRHSFSISIIKCLRRGFNSR